MPGDCAYGMRGRSLELNAQCLTWGPWKRGSHLMVWGNARRPQGLSTGLGALILTWDSKEVGTPSEGNARGPLWSLVGNEQLAQLV